MLDTIRKREKQGKKFTIIAMAEGAISDEDAKLSKKELKEKRKTYTFPSVAYQLSDELQKKAGQEELQFPDMYSVEEFQVHQTEYLQQESELRLQDLY